MKTSFLVQWTFLQTDTDLIQTIHENWMFCATFNLKLIAIFKMQHWSFAVDFNLLRHYPEKS